MKKTFLFIVSIALLSCVPFINSLFQKNVEAVDKPEPSLYLTGNNEYRQNGIISFSSQESPVINISGKYLEESEITIDIYEANVQDVLKFLTYNNDNKQIDNKVSLDNRNKIGTFKTKWEDSLELPYGDENGIFLVHAQVGDLEVNSFTIRSSVGAVVKEVENELLIWTQNFDTKRKMKGQKVTFYNLKNGVSKQKNAVTNNDGIATAPISSQYDVAIVGNGNNLAFVPVSMRQLGYGGNYSFANQDPDNKYFIFTDRLLYKPGDKIYFKSILRDDNDVDYYIPSGSWRAKVVSGWGDKAEIISEEVFSLDSYGTFDGEFQLPEEVKTGDYRFIVEKVGSEQENDGYRWSDNSSETYFQVEYYRKPEYMLDMDIDQTQIISGNNINFDIEGRYFSGQPLNGIEVDYVVRESNFYNSTFYYPRQLENFNYGYYYGSKEVKVGKATLDSEGLAQVSFDANVKDGKNKIYSIELNYASAAGGENVREQKNVLVFAGEYDIYRENYRYNFNVDEEIEIDLILKDNDEDKDLANKILKVSPKRVWWDKKLIETLRDKPRYEYKRGEEFPEGFEIVTDSGGVAKLRFSPKNSGAYEFKVQGVDSQGNNIEKNFRIWVSNRNYSYDGYGSKGLSVILDRDTYEPGENVSVDISSEMPDRDVLFSVERNFIHEYKVVSMNGNSANVNFKALDEYMPNADVGIASFSNDKVDINSVNLKVSAENKRLNISIETDKEVYDNGGDVKTKIKVTDKDGKPQKAEVTLWAVDKAIFELSDPSGQRAFDALWSYRNGSTSFTHSLRGLTVNAAEKGGCFKGDSQVLMEDKTVKNIEDVKVGDYILTRENENDGNLVEAKVIKNHNVEVDGYFVINNNLNVTENHIVRVNNEWRRADQVKIGDTLISQNDEEIVINSIEWRKEKTMVYNLEIEEKHSFFVNGVWVHNGKAGGAGRSIFKDVAYWNPKIVTDENGEAEVSFELSDDLTTWVFSAVGITKDAKVGNANHEIRVSQPVILRPNLPNIFYTEDEVNVSVEAQNFSGKKRNFQVMLEFDGGEVRNDLQEIEIEDGEIKEIVFTIYPKEEKESQLTFSLESKDEDLIGDRITKKVSIEKFGFLEKSSSTHKANEDINLEISEDALNDETEVNLEVSATLIGSLPSAVEYLVNYPYGCIEQTTSRFRAVLAVKQNPEIFYKVNQEKDIDAILNEGIERLSKMQNYDGGWSWWSGKESSPFISIYVAESLLEAQDAGIEVDEEMINKTKDYFEKYNYSQWKEGGSEISHLEKIITVVYGRSIFNSEKIYKLELKSELDPDIIALGVMANIRNGFTDSETNGLNILKSKLQQEGNHKYWLRAHYNRFGSVDASTALGLRAFLMADVKKEEIDSVVKYLMDSRKKRYWSSTFATSKVIHALTEYSNKYDENLNINKNIKVYQDDKNILNETLGLKKQSINVPVSIDNLKQEGSNLKIKSNDDVYVTLVKKEFRTDRNAQIVSNGISIERSYRNENQIGGIGKGDIIDVEVKVSGLNKDNAYLVVEDKLPAGLIPVNENLKNTSFERDGRRYSYAQREYTKNGIIFHREYINSDSLLLSYKAKAISSGVFIDPPAVAEMMYNSDVYARTSVQTLEISPESQQENLVKEVVEVSPFKKLLGCGQEILVIMVSLIVIAYGIIVLVRDKFKV